MHEGYQIIGQSRPTSQLANQRRASIPRTANQSVEIIDPDVQGWPIIYPSQLGWYPDTTSQSVTTLMIALDLSDTTHQSADHNVALSRVLNQSINRLNISISTDLTMTRQHSLHQSAPSLDSANTAETVWDIKSVKTSHNLAQI
ncbi:hypothetical protein F511_11304 [Dorcoceras hygrometricum]|uniref:Uncharacterized protein n=1 Tax=Dorcoceras hygrometricum TaxID=472368 RepID=A0A2Z7CID4_9LAMI|nr:hypothetical protein F511_11304 [Dorcoceras hygrometricum]